MGLDEVRIAFAGHALDHRAEQDEAVVRIIALTAWRESRSPVAIEFDQIVDGANPGAVGRILALQYPRIARAAAMVQKLPDGHLCHLPVRIVRQIA